MRLIQPASLALDNSTSSTRPKVAWARIWARSAGSSIIAFNRILLDSYSFSIPVHIPNTHHFSCWNTYSRHHNQRSCRSTYRRLQALLFDALTGSIGQQPAELSPSYQNRALLYFYHNSLCCRPSQSFIIRLCYHCMPVKPFKVTSVTLTSHTLTVPTLSEAATGLRTHHRYLCMCTGTCSLSSYPADMQKTR